MLLQEVINVLLWKQKHSVQTREVMAYSGPRMLFYHPVMAIKHVIETQKEKRRLENAK